MDPETLSELTRPSRRIAAACLLSAYRDLWKPVVGGSDVHPERRLAIRAEAREWFLSNAYDFYSFLYLCDLLSLEPTAVRQHVLREWRQFKITSKRRENKDATD